MSISNFLFLLGGLVIFLGFFIWLVISLPFQSIVISGDFIYPMLPAALLTRVFFYSQWERKNKRLIFASGNFVAKVYAYPYIVNTQNQPNIS